MRFSWTIKELKAASDAFVLRSLVAERMSSGLNPYAPLYRRLAAIHKKLDRQIEATEMRRRARIIQHRNRTTAIQKETP